jgi:hypothetical protein
MVLNWGYLLTLPLLRQVRKPWAVPAWVAGGLLWLNVNPMAAKRSEHQDKLMNTLYSRFGIEMKHLNDKLPRWTYVDDVDRQTRRLMRRRNGWLAGILYPTDDYTPVLSTKDINTAVKLIK